MKTRTFLLCFALPAILAITTSFVYGEAVPPQQPPSTKWEKEIAAFETADKTTPPPQKAILFVGSSSIRLWDNMASYFPGYQIIQRGFGGGQLSDVVQYADRIVIPYNPRVIIVGAGGNDIRAHRSPEEVLASFQAFVGKVRAKLPNVRICFMSLYPSPSDWKWHEQQEKANALVAKYISTGADLHYIDLWTPMLGADGQPRIDIFKADKHHNNEAGYKIRVAAILPFLK